MAQISNYLYSNIKPYLTSFKKIYESENIHPYTKSKRISSSSIYSNYSLFTNEMGNKNLKSIFNNNNAYINYYDFGSNLNKPLSYEFKREKKYMSKSTEQDLDMMKLQLRCDLIGQKINQIQSQVQNFRELNSKDNKKLLRKNRTYGNLDRNNNQYLNNNNKDKAECIGKKNFSKIPFPIKKEIELSDDFRRKKNKNKEHNISYVNKNIKNNSLINDCNNKKRKINNFKQTHFYNSTNLSNKDQYINDNNYKDKKYNKIIINKINSNPNILKRKENNIIQFNNYISDYNIKYNFIPNTIDRNNKKTNKKTQIIRKNFSAHKSKSYNISPNKKNLIYNKRKLNGIKENTNYEKISNNVAKYGSFDRYFFNDNNCTDNSYKNYIDTIKNNFYEINYNNLEKIKHNSFNNDKRIQSAQIKKNNLVIQKENNLNFINKTKSKNTRKETNKANFQTVSNYNNFINKNKTFNMVKDINDKNYAKFQNHYYKKKENKNYTTQINNNFNVNNNTNYYNFNYNQNFSNTNYINNSKNTKNNKTNTFKTKNNNIMNKKNTQNKKLNDNIEESNENNFLRFNHDYSKDDLVQPSYMLNSIKDNNINWEYIKNPCIISENKIRTNINSKRKKHQIK